MSYDRQCSSCGGFCGRGGCKRENVKPEQEPVAWMMVNEEHGHKPTLHWKPQEDWHITWKAVPLYATPPTRKPLTDEQIDAEFDRECWVTVVFADGTKGIALDKVTAKDFARAIERAHGITND